MSCRAKDVEIVAEARRQGAVIVSYDQDFTAILATSGATQPSLINLRVSYVDAASLVREIAAVVRATESALAAGAIVTLDDALYVVHAERGARERIISARRATAAEERQYAQGDG